MGSCFSKNNQGRDPPAVDPGLSPPPPEEEETVKEVLSETPVRASSACCTREFQRGRIRQPMPHQGAAGVTAANDVHTSASSGEKVKARGVEPHSPVKYRARRSFSSAGGHQSMRPSSSAAFARKSDACVSSSPTPAVITKKSTDVRIGCRNGRSSSPSKVRKEGAVRRTNSAREAASSRAPWPGNSSPPRRRDPGEGSGSRRSFSTAAKRAAPPRLCSGASSSPRRIPSDGRRPVQDSAMEASTTPEAAGKESLETPLVSLECFIFL